MNTPTQAQPVTEFDISGLEAMLAGTLCLMSAYSHCNCDNAENQGLINLKIVSNLTCLQCQNGLSPEFRRVLAKVCESWRQHSLLTHAAAGASQDNTLLWHNAPSAVH
ncbi:hypothetical protein [Variovorax sp. PCZ-1]|uniref:hypothetical protein n=1 Tax=Variovorax sp. PCZ-1 TaxID=2835533 RepID=UPI001BCFA4C6|nr:hypothetical protein [Variovorax sp. PCZ-1]MBS7807733.1 hypothetical protein [Variovorax sp. PCZ-1]